MLKDGTIYSGTYTFSTTVPESHSFDIVVTYTSTGNTVRIVVGYLSTGNFQFSIMTTGSVDILAAKLEIGTESMLTNDTAPNYATELLKCQRYFKKLYLYPAVLREINSHSIGFSIENSGVMRTTPTKSIGDLHIASQTNYVDGFSFGFGGNEYITMISGYKDGHGLSMNNILTLSGYIFLSADL